MAVQVVDAPVGTCCWSCCPVPSPELLLMLQAPFEQRKYSQQLIQHSLAALLNPLQTNFAQFLAKARHQQATHISAHIHATELSLTLPRALYMKSHADLPAHFRYYCLGYRQLYMCAAEKLHILSLRYSWATTRGLMHHQVCHCTPHEHSSTHCGILLW